MRALMAIGLILALTGCENEAANLARKDAAEARYETHELTKKLDALESRVDDLESNQE